MAALTPQPVLTQETQQERHEPADEAPPVPERRPLLHRLRQLGRPGWLGIVAAALAVLSFTIVALHVHRYPTLSPIDELQHFDYAYKVAHGELVRNGDRVGDFAMRTEACRTVDAPGFVAPPCDSETLHPDQFQELGYNTAASQSPLYYVVTGWTARALDLLPGVGGFFDAARLAGGLWLLLGALTVVLLAAHLGAPKGAQLAVAGLAITSPLVLHATATVNTDGSLLATGGAVALLTLLWEERRIPLALLLGAAFLAFVVEPTNILVGVLCGAYLVLRGALTQTGRRIVVTLAVAAGVVVSMYAANVITGEAKTALAGEVEVVELPKDKQFATTELAMAQVAENVPALVTPLAHPYLPPFLRSSLMHVAVMASNWMLLGGVIGAALWSSRSSRVTAMACAALFVMVVAGPALVLYNFATSSVYFAIPSRYGLSLLPALFAVLAAGFRSRRALGIGWAVTGLGMTATMLGLLGMA